jgi:hypothetical protein
MDEHKIEAQMVSRAYLSSAHEVEQEIPTIHRPEQYRVERINNETSRSLRSISG